jgi:hypothetical protein
MGIMQVIIALAKQGAWQAVHEWSLLLSDGWNGAYITEIANREHRFVEVGERTSREVRHVKGYSTARNTHLMEQFGRKELPVTTALPTPSKEQLKRLHVVSDKSKEGEKVKIDDIMGPLTWPTAQSSSAADRKLSADRFFLKSTYQTKHYYLAETLYHSVLLPVGGVIFDVANAKIWYVLCHIDNEAALVMPSKKVYADAFVIFDFTEHKVEWVCCGDFDKWRVLPTRIVSPATMFYERYIDKGGKNGCVCLKITGPPECPYDFTARRGFPGMPRMILNKFLKRVGINIEDFTDADDGGEEANGVGRGGLNGCTTPTLMGPCLCPLPGLFFWAPSQVVGWSRLNGCTTPTLMGSFLCTLPGLLFSVPTNGVGLGGLNGCTTPSMKSSCPCPLPGLFFWVASQVVGWSGLNGCTTPSLTSSCPCTLPGLFFSMPENGVGRGGLNGCTSPPLTSSYPCSLPGLFFLGDSQWCGMGRIKTSSQGGWGSAFMMLHMQPTVARR